MSGRRQDKYGYIGDPAYSSLIRSSFWALTFSMALAAIIMSGILTSWRNSDPMEVGNVKVKGVLDLSMGSIMPPTWEELMLPSKKKGPIQVIELPSHAGNFLLNGCELHVEIPLGVSGSQQYHNKAYKLLSVIGATHKIIISSGGATWDKENQYTTIMSGASMACPHVAGACALMLSLYPALEVNEVTNLLQQSADPITPGVCASGRLNLYEALQAVTGFEAGIMRT